MYSFCVLLHSALLLCDEVASRTVVVQKRSSTTYGVERGTGRRGARPPTEKTGEITQEAAMPARPPSKAQLRQFQPAPTAAAPTVAPTMACVVLTGMAVKVTSSRNTAAANSEAIMAIAAKRLFYPRHQHADIDVVNTFYAQHIYTSDGYIYK